MKKFLLSIGALICGLSTYAGVADFDFAQMGYENAQDVTVVTEEPVVITFDKGTGNNAPKYYNTGSAVRVYGGNTITVTAGNKEITEINFTFSTGEGTNEITVNNGTFDATNWSGSSASVTFTIGGTSGHRRIAAMSVTYSDNEVEPSVPDYPGGTINVATALQLMSAGYEGEATVKGVISRIQEVSTNYGNATYFIKDDLSDENALEIYRGYYLNGDKFTSTDQLEVGATVVVYGDLVNYNGTFEFTTGSMIVSYESPENGGDEPTTPEYPGGTIDVATALNLMTNGYEGEATVKGIISEISEVSINYGNATYFIKDNLSDENALEIYRGYYLNGDKFTSTDQLEVGATVVVTGNLVNYNGTFEFTSGSKILSYEAPQGGGNQGGDDDKFAPLEGETAVFNFADPYSLTANPSIEISDDLQEVDLTDVTLTSGKISMVSTAAEGATTPPRLWNSNGNWTFRFYKDETITISAEEGYIINGIEFTATNLGNASIVYTGDGEFANNVWNAYLNSQVNKVVISKTESGNNPTVTNMTVYYTTASAVSSIEDNENAPVEYFNLQGLRVNNPVKGGLYIMRQGNKSAKVIVR